MKKVLSVFIAACLVLSLCTGIFTSVPSARALSLNIGDSYGGGIVAYILQSGDPGYAAGVTKGLIAAAADQNIVSANDTPWALGANQFLAVPGGTLTDLGSGSANTDRIIAQNGAGRYAAGLARAYTGGGYSDWYLPSKDELNKLYLNRAAIGGFVAWYYSSSSEYYTVPDSMWIQSFPSGTPNSGTKNNVTYAVRPVRSFTVSSDASLLGGTLGGVSLSGTFTGALTIGSSSGSTVTVPAGTLALVLTKSNANSTIKYVLNTDGWSQPTDAGSYTGTYSDSPATTIPITSSNDRIWLMVTAEDGTTVRYCWIIVTVMSSDATITGGALAGVALVGTSWAGGASTALSTELTVTVFGGEANDIFGLTKGNANSVVRYVVGLGTPADNAAYTLTYGSDTTIDTTSNTIIWLLVTAEDGTTKLYYKITTTAASSNATVTSATYTVSAGGTVSETITDVPFGTAKATFLAGLAKGQAHQTWNVTGLADPVASANTLVVTAQDGTTVVTYTVTVTANIGTVTIAAGAGGSVLPTTSVSQAYGATGTAIVATHNNGSHFVGWSATSNPTYVSIADSSAASTTFTTTSLMPDGGTATITATFAANTGTVTIAAGAHGSVSSSPVLQTYGSTGATITATPDAGYHLQTWSATSNPTYVSIADSSAASTTFTTTSLMPDGGTATITATFAVNTYAVTVTSGPNGTVTPGTGTVDYHTTQAYAVKPNPGYLIDTLMVDGIAVREAAGRLGFTLTLTDVTAPHTITATFRAIPDVLSPIITIPDFSAWPGVIGWSGGTVPSFTVESSPFPLQFTLEDNSGSAKWTIKVNGIVVIDPVGAGLITYPVPLSEGRNDVEVSASDAVGNRVIQALVIYLDSMGPVLTIEPALPATVTTPRLTIAGSVADAVSGLKWVSINGTAVVPFLDGSFREILTLAKGANAIVIEAEDKVGHRTTTTHTVTYATAIQPLPTATVIALTIGKATMSVDGMAVALDTAPVIKESRTMLPIRAIAEAISASVEWDPVARKATITRGATKIELWIGKSIATLNAKSISIDAANSKVVPYVTNGRTLLPVRFIAEALGLDVEWNASTRVVKLTLRP